MGNGKNFVSGNKIKKATKVFYITFFAVILSTSYFSNPVYAGMNTCEIDTIEKLKTEFDNGNAYIQFHTDTNGDASDNTSPTDLGSPGAIRGNIHSADAGDSHDWEASINAGNEVIHHLPADEQAHWQSVTAHGDITLTTHNDHIQYQIHLHDNGLHNVVGIHIHQGDPTENNHVHLVDIKETDVNSPIHVTTLDGEIDHDDLCPTHVHGGGGDGGLDDRLANSIEGPLGPTTSIVLAGQVLQPGDYFPLVDYGSLDILGHLSLRIPCNADMLPLVTPVAGHINADPAKTVMQQSHLMLVEHLSTAGKTCFYQADLPIFNGHHIEYEGAPLISHIGLLNTCDNNAVFRTGNVMSFTLQEVIGDINDYPYGNGPIIPDSSDHTIVDLPNHQFIQGHVCGN